MSLQRTIDVSDLLYPQYVEKVREQTVTITHFEFLELVERARLAVIEAMTNGFYRSNTYDGRTAVLKYQVGLANGEVPEGFTVLPALDPHRVGATKHSNLARSSCNK